LEFQPDLTGQPKAMSSGSRLLILFTLAVALVVGGVVSLATGSWWFLILPVAVHVVATTVVLLTIGSRLREHDKPDPVTEARLAEQDR
jgi:membrane protein implicated in regulation of membrane protease activity